VGEHTFFTITYFKTISGEKYHLKVGVQQTLKLGLGGEKFSGVVSLFIKRKEYPNRPFTGEGSCATYPDDEGKI
jgi:hypothetical protein